MSYKNQKKPLPEIRRELGIDAVLEGSVVREGDRVRTSVRLIQATRERVLLSEAFEKDIRDFSTLRNSIVLVVADETRVKLLKQEQAQLARVRSVNPQALEAYLKGRFLQARRTPEDMPRSLAYFQRALEIDPSYTDAYVGIIDCYSIGAGRHMGISVKEADAKMREPARKVVELDGTTAAAHYALAMMKWHDWDFPSAEKEFQLALELNPSDVQVRQHYAHYLLGMRRPADARRQIQYALILDPLSPMLTVDVGHTYNYAGQYPEAIKQGEKALAMQKDFLYARMMLGWAYWRAGRVQDAFGVGWPNPFRPESSRRAKEIYEQAGAAPMLRWLAHDAEQRNGTADFYGRSAQIARWYALLDDKEKVFAWLEKAYLEHDPWLPVDMAEPQFDKLNSDARFQDLLRRIGLPL